MRLHSMGVEINYEQYGSAGPNVLLLHGWGCSVALWKPIAERLSGSMRVTAVDFPAHGESGRMSEPWDAKAFADQIVDIIHQLGLEGCTVIGHSHGGRVALSLAIDHPRLIDKLIITCGAGVKPKKTFKREMRSRSYKIMRGILSALETTRLFGKLPEYGKEALRQKFGSKDYNALDAEMRKTFVLLVSGDITDELPRVSQPTLLIWGERDTETPLWMGKLMEEKIPDAGLVVFEDAGHFAYLEQPDRFSAIASQFILD
ncbi:alpha/beta hydrolase [Clostridia bacterium]|nr:alpha/beta hydrolase [Clostridia bacterium]